MDEAEAELALAAGVVPVVAGAAVAAGVVAAGDAAVVVGAAATAEAVVDAAGAGALAADGEAGADAVPPIRSRSVTSRSNARWRLAGTVPDWIWLMREARPEANVAPGAETAAELESAPAVELEAVLAVEAGAALGLGASTFSARMSSKSACTRRRISRAIECP